MRSPASRRPVCCAREKTMPRHRDATFQPKHASATRTPRPKPNFERSLETLEPIATAGSVQLEEVASPPPQSPVEAVTVEQPLPLMMAGITLWGVGITAFVLF